MLKPTCAQVHKLTHMALQAPWLPWHQQDKRLILAHSICSLKGVHGTQLGAQHGMGVLMACQGRMRLQAGCSFVPC